MSLYFSSRLIGGGQEIVGGVVDGQPDLLGRAIILAELLLRGLVQSGGVDELVGVVGRYGEVHGVVGALVRAVLEVVGGDHVASLVLRANAGVDVDAVEHVADQAKGEVGLDGRVLGNRAGIASAIAATASELAS